MLEGLFGMNLVTRAVGILAELTTPLANKKRAKRAHKKLKKRVPNYDAHTVYEAPPELRTPTEEALINALYRAGDFEGASRMRADAIMRHKKHQRYIDTINRGGAWVPKEKKKRKKTV